MLAPSIKVYTVTKETEQISIIFFCTETLRLDLEHAKVYLYTVTTPITVTWIAETRGVTCIGLR